MDLTTQKPTAIVLVSENGAEEADGMEMLPGQAAGGVSTAAWSRESSYHYPQPKCRTHLNQGSLIQAPRRSAQVARAQQLNLE